MAAGSPCIDAGSPYEALDRDGSRADLGATGGGGQLPAVPRIEIDGDTLAVSTSHPENIVVRNTGSADLVIDGIDVALPFSTTISLPRTVAVGDSVLIPVAFSGVETTTGILTISHSDAYQSARTVFLRGAVGTGVSGAVSGTWSRDGAPYVVTGPITVAAGDTLAIGPGVDVQFAAFVPFVVRGYLAAIGTESDSIRFTAIDSVRWRGLQFVHTDSSTVAFGRITSSQGQYAAEIDHSDVSFVSSRIDGLGRSGILLADSSFGMFSRCTIRPSHPTDYEAAFWTGIRATASRISVVGCTIAWSGAGIDIANGSASIDSSVFHKLISGAAIYALRSTIAIMRTRFAGWQGTQSTGVNASVANLTMTDCVVSGFYWGINLTTDYSGVPSTGKFTNCTIAGNTNALTCYSGSAEMRNCITWQNRADGPLFSSVSYSVVTLVSGHTNGTGNIEADPQFVDAANGDFRLRSTSPCIDAGDPASPADADGSRTDMGARYVLSMPVAIEPEARPSAFSLSQNAPNPFNPTTVIRYSLAQPGKTRLAIYDANGRLVRVLVDEARTAGVYEVVWDGTDAAGRSCASGVYVYRLVAKDGTIVRRMTMVR